MNKIKKFLLAAMMLVFCFGLTMPMQTEAAKKVSMDAYLAKGSKYTILVYNNTHNRTGVWSKANTNSKSYGSIGYGDTMIVNKSKLKTGKKYAWIPVYMNNMKTGSTWKTGYVIAGRVQLHTLYTKRFSTNNTVNKAIKTGFKYLGTPFNLGSSSLSSAIDCANFVNQCYASAGKRLVSYAHTNYLQGVCKQVFWYRRRSVLPKSYLNKMKAGDLLFYYGGDDDTSANIDHVAMYIGDGFMINSSGHVGERYPMGGITIKKVQYGNRYMIRCMRPRSI